MIGEKVLMLLICPEIIPHRQELFDLLVDCCLAHSRQRGLIEIAKSYKEAAQPKVGDRISMEGRKSCEEYIAFLDHVIAAIIHKAPEQSKHMMPSGQEAINTLL